MYKIVRMFTHRETGPGGHVATHRRTIEKGLTLAEAQAHCNDRETSSRTCRRDRYRGQYAHWFDGYSEQ